MFVSTYAAASCLNPAIEVSKIEEKEASEELFRLVVQSLERELLLDFQMVKLLKDNGINLAVANLGCVRETLLLAGFDTIEVKCAMQHVSLIFQAMQRQELDQEMLLEVLQGLPPKEQLKMIQGFSPDIVREIVRTQLPEEVLVEILENALVENNFSMIRVIEVSPHGFAVNLKLLLNNINDKTKIQKIMKNCHGQASIADTLSKIIFRGNLEMMQPIMQSPYGLEMMQITLLRTSLDNPSIMPEIMRSPFGFTTVLQMLRDARRDQSTLTRIQSSNGLEMLLIAIIEAIKKRDMDRVQEIIEFLCDFNFLTKILSSATIQKNPDAKPIIMQIASRVSNEKRSLR
ncbi:MAG: hypothetical protein LBH08_03800 [Puniceicoccales bacterium]|nr:hypothetical protein [Puniceicoccales bacterium]